MKFKLYELTFLKPVGFIEPLPTSPSCKFLFEREGLANDMVLYWNLVTCEIAWLFWHSHYRLGIHRGFYIFYSALSVKFVFWSASRISRVHRNLTFTLIFFFWTSSAEFNMPYVKMNISVTNISIELHNNPVRKVWR